MIELAPEERRNTIIRNCGARPIGERSITQNGADVFAYFLDPLTKSTLFLPVEEVTAYNVRRKLQEARTRFGAAIIELALIGNLELIEQFKLFILSLERTKNLPEPVVNAAANAAVMEIYSYESAIMEPENATAI
jgi:hypothetical protein